MLYLGRGNNNPLGKVHGFLDRGCEVGGEKALWVTPICYGIPKMLPDGFNGNLPVELREWVEDREEPFDAPGWGLANKELPLNLKLNQSLSFL